MAEYTSTTLRAVAGIRYCDCGFHGFFEMLAHRPDCPYRFLLAHADAMERLEQRVKVLEQENDGLRAFRRSVDEALDSGDGAYRP